MVDRASKKNATRTAGARAASGWKREMDSCVRALLLSQAAPLWASARLKTFLRMLLHRRCACAMRIRLGPLAVSLRFQGHPLNSSGENPYMAAALLMACVVNARLPRMCMLQRFAEGLLPHSCASVFLLIGSLPDSTRALFTASKIALRTAQSAFCAAVSRDVVFFRFVDLDSCVSDR